MKKVIYLLSILFLANFTSCEKSEESVEVPQENPPVFNGGNGNPDTVTPILQRTCDDWNGIISVFKDRSVTSIKETGECGEYREALSAFLSGDCGTQLETIQYRDMLNKLSNCN